MGKKKLKVTKPSQIDLVLLTFFNYMQEVSLFMKADWSSQMQLTQRSMLYLLRVRPN